MTDTKLKQNHEPLIHITKRDDSGFWKSALVHLIGIVIALMLSSLLIALTQADRCDGSRTRTHHSAKGRAEVHHRHCERQTRNSQRTNTLTNEDAVHNVVERRRHHSNDGGHRIALQELGE